MSFEDFKEEAKDNMERMQELNLLKKAVPNAQKLKQFLYTDDDNLRSQVMMIYPECTNIIIVNNDTRDGLGVPTINTRQIRVNFITQTRSQGSRIISQASYENFKVILCLVENGVVNVKVVTREGWSY